MEEVTKLIKDFYYKEASLEHFFKWYNDILKKIIDLTKNIRHLDEWEEYNRNRDIRMFYDEIYPLNIFLKSRGSDFDKVFITGEQERYDAVLKNGDRKTVVEITRSRDGEFDLYSMRHLFKFKRVPINPSSKTNDLKKAIDDCNPLSTEYISTADTVKKEANNVSKAIKNKCEKDYPENTILIVTGALAVPNLDISIDLPRKYVQKLKNMGSEIKEYCPIKNSDDFVTAPKFDIFKCLLEIPENNFSRIYFVDVGGFESCFCRPLS